MEDSVPVSVWTDLLCPGFAGEVNQAALTIQEGRVSL